MCRTKSQHAGRIMLASLVRSESAALLASGADVFNREGQRGGWLWPPQQRAPEPTGKSLGATLLNPSVGWPRAARREQPNDQRDADRASRGATDLGNRGSPG